MSRYVTLADYEQFYTDAIGAKDFNRFVLSASALADRLTTGVDGVKKLKVAFPTDENDAEVVKAAICGVIHLMHVISKIEQATVDSQGMVTREDGTVIGKTVTSISSGSESISYSAGASNSGVSLNSLVGNASAQNEAYNTIISEGFRTIKDANGVNLMYRGLYPLEYGR